MIDWLCSLWMADRSAGLNARQRERRVGSLTDRYDDPDECHTAAQTSNWLDDSVVL